MKIAVLGTGGVGGYFGGMLAKAGNDVTFLARGAHLKAIQKNGLTVKSIYGDFTVKVVKATDDITTIGSPDLVLVALKAWQVKDIAKLLSPILKPETIIIPLQNGVLATDELKEYINHEHIVGGLCRIISKIESPGVINHSGIEPTLIFGELNKTKTERVQQVKTVFDNASIHSILTDNITAELWKKFIIICVSGLLAVTKTNYGELRALKETRQLMIELLKEVFNLSQKAGVGIESDFVEKATAFIHTYPADSTSSLTRDVWEGKPSEIEYQNGTVVTLAEKYGVDVPVNRFVYSCILPMDIKARRG